MNTPPKASDVKQNLKTQVLIDLRNEVKILSELRHPNVVLYIGVCTEIPNVCIVTELCPRRSLFDIIHDPSVALSCELRLRMALQAAQGMAYLHNQVRDFESIFLATIKLLHSQSYVKILHKTLFHELFCPLFVANAYYSS